MCGIVGVMSKTKTHLTSSDRKRFTDLVEVDVLRGRDSTGVYGANHNLKTMADKEAVPGGMFTAMEGYGTVVAHSSKFLVGHNRWATVGKVNKDNAHPFETQDIILVHNGTLDDTSNLEMHQYLDVDSEMVAFEMQSHSKKKVLEKLQGAFTLVWFDERDKTLNFARNTERPLWYAERGNCLYWASEKAMLQLVLERDKVRTKISYHELPVGKLLSYHMDTDKITSLDFTPAPVWDWNRSYSQSYSSRNYRRQPNYSQQRKGTGTQRYKGQAACFTVHSKQVKNGNCTISGYNTAGEFFQCYQAPHHIIRDDIVQGEFSYCSFSNGEECINVVKGLKIITATQNGRSKPKEENPLKEVAAGVKEMQEKNRAANEDEEKKSNVIALPAPEKHVDSERAGPDITEENANFMCSVCGEEIDGLQLTEATTTYSNDICHGHCYDESHK